MSEEQYKHIDQRFRDAAENQDHPFDESNWKRMEKLLDQEDERKRPFLWWWISLGLLILLSGAVFWAFSDKSSPQSVKGISQRSAEKNNIDHQLTGKQSQSSSSIKTRVNDQPGVTDHSVYSSEKADLSIIDSKHPGTSIQQPQQIQTKAKPDGDVFAAKNSFTKPVHHQHKNASVRHNTRQSKQKDRQQLSVESPMPEELAKVNPIRTKVQEKEFIESVPGQTTFIEKGLASEDVVEDKNAKVKIEDSIAENQKKIIPIVHADTLKPGKPESGNGRRPGFYLVAGLGADLSSTRLLSTKNSPVSPRLGLGAGYRFTKRLSVQTGFYSSTKKYLARAGDYKVSADPYWNQVTLVGVDAKCLVFEIPMQVKYDVVQKSGWSVYAMAGLSSYLMKKETYDYAVVRYGNAYRYSYSYTGNRHPFSVLGLSAGWQKDLSKKISMTIEPYVQLPFAGVGEGKVKLYSFGIQTGILFDPAAKKRSKK